MIFRGTGTALVTPFTADNRVDLPALRKLIDFQIEGGVEALVILGTTGENPTVSGEERKMIVEESIRWTNKRIPVIVGTGTNDTMDCIRYSREAVQAGADALLIVGPYYNKPTPKGYIEHFKAVADVTADCPIIAYNVPGRTGSNISAQTMLQIAEEIPSVVAVKEACGDLGQISEILQHKPADFAVYSGDDELTLPIVALGGDGSISVLSNALPKQVSELTRLVLAGEIFAARKLHFELIDLMRLCFIESNPIPIKTLVAEIGLINDRLRLPLVPMELAHKAKLLEAYEAIQAIA